MTILTLDVGLKNLALCIMSKSKTQIHQIHLWEVFNLLDEQKIHLCSATTKKGKLCGKKCLFTYKTDSELHFSCKTHVPKGLSCNQIKIKQVKDYLLQDIARRVLEKINEIHNEYFSLFSDITKIFIELQPKINNKMKLISHLIYGKFVELYVETSVPVRFVRASHKLKAYKGPAVTCNLKTPYAKRKYLSIQYTHWFLNESNQFLENTKWSHHFNSHSKKDDLGDVFLMAINSLK